MPDGTAFSRMFDRTLTDVDRSNDKRAGFSGIASDIAKSTFMIPRAIYDEIDRKKRIETIALETSIEMLDFGIAGDEDGMMKSYEKGKQKGIRAYYSHIPEMQGELVPNETYIPVNGKQYLFKGWGVDDVLLERAR